MRETGLLGRIYYFFRDILDKFGNTEKREEKRRQQSIMLKKDMCKNAQSICDHDCEFCAWFVREDE